MPTSGGDGQPAQFLTLSLPFTPGFVVTSVPVHPKSDEDAEDIVPLRA